MLHRSRNMVNFVAMNIQLHFNISTYIVNAWSLLKLYFYICDPYQSFDDAWTWLVIKQLFQYRYKYSKWDKFFEFGFRYDNEIPRPTSFSLGRAQSVALSWSRSIGCAQLITLNRSRSIGCAQSVALNRSRSLGWVHNQISVVFIYNIP